MTARHVGKSKYGVRLDPLGVAARTVDGLTFASLKEARRYQFLKHFEGTVLGPIECQPRFPLVVNGVKVGTYVADFRYVHRPDQTTVVEDVKGMKTPLYRLKAKLVKALYGIEIREVMSPTEDTISLAPTSLRAVRRGAPVSWIDDYERFVRAERGWDIDGLDYVERVLAVLRAAERLIAAGSPDSPSDECVYCISAEPPRHHRDCEWLALRNALKGEHP